MQYDREEIKKRLLKRYSKKIKKTVLDKNIEGLIDEYIEQQEFVRKNGKSIEDIPTKEQIKWWFQDEPQGIEVEVSPGIVEEAYEVQIDNICLKDKLAYEVFTTFYKYVWKQGEEIPSVIKQLIRLTKLAETTKNKKNKEAIRTRLANIALVGVIRFYHKERKPYLCPSQISRAITFFRNALLVIDKIESGKYKEKVVKGDLAIFDPFREDNDIMPDNKDTRKQDETE